MVLQELVSLMSFFVQYFQNLIWLNFSDYNYYYASELMVVIQTPGNGGFCALRVYRIHQPQRDHRTRLECREQACVVRLLWSEKPRIRTTDQCSSLPVEEESRNPRSYREQELVAWSSSMCLQCVWEDRKEGITYKNGRFLAQSNVLEGTSWKGKKVWLPLGK